MCVCVCVCERARARVHACVRACVCVPGAWKSAYTQQYIPVFLNTY